MKLFAMMFGAMLAMSAMGANVLLTEQNPARGTLRYPGKGNFRSDRGTAEFWVKLGDRFGLRKQNEHLASLILDENHSIGFYYNDRERGMVFFIKNVDAPGGNRHSKDYSAFLVMPKLDWKPGQRHHIAITYEPEHQLLYLDGKAVRWQEFHGSLAGRWNERSRIEIARDSEFIVEAFRIWDDAYAPRALKDDVNTGVNVFRHAEFPAAAELDGAALTAGGNRFLWIADQPLPASIAAGKLELLPGGVQLRFGDRAAAFRGRPAVSNGQLTAKFTVKEYPSLELETAAVPFGGDAVRLVLTLTNRGDRAWREDVTLDLGALVGGGMAFATTVGAPFALETGNPAYAHSVSASSGMGGGKPGFSLPVAAVYHPKQNIGLAVAQPMSVRDRIAIDFGGETSCRYWSTTNEQVDIPPGESRTLEYYFKVHPGDFRSALQLILDISPEAFVPQKINSARRQAIDGGMMIGGPSDPASLQQSAAQMICYREISIGNGKQILFGEYVPEKPDAESLAYYTGINRQIAALHRAGILGMIYLQARECQRIGYAKAKFPESLQYDSSGKVIESYSFGAKMLCRKDSNWYNHLLDQLRKSLEAMPEADGVFFDNCWDLEYADIINAYGDYLHRRGLLLETNGITNPCARCSDSVMAEGTRKTLEELCFYGLAKPVTYVPIYSYHGFGIAKEREMAAPALPGNLARDLKSCLINGAFYSFNYRGSRYFGGESRRMFSHYLELQRELQGKRWYLEAHALVLPKGFQGNIYCRRDGGLAAFVVSAGMPFTGDPAGDFTVRIRIGNLAVSKVTVRHLEDDRETPAEFTRAGSEDIEIRIKNHISVTMIKVE